MEERLGHLPCYTVFPIPQMIARKQAASHQIMYETTTVRGRFSRNCCTTSAVQQEHHPERGPRQCHGVAVQHVSRRITSPLQSKENFPVFDSPRSILTRRVVTSDRASLAQMLQPLLLAAMMPVDTVELAKGDRITCISRSL